MIEQMQMRESSNKKVQNQSKEQGLMRDLIDDAQGKLLIRFNQHQSNILKIFQSNRIKIEGLKDKLNNLKMNQKKIRSL